MMMACLGKHNYKWLDRGTIDQVVSNYNPSIDLAVRNGLEFNLLEKIYNFTELPRQYYQGILDDMLDTYNYYIKKKEDKTIAKIKSMQEAIIAIYDIGVEREYIKQEHGIK